MSIKFNYTAHKKMWIWLARNPKKNKYDWPGWEFNGGSYALVRSSCFACEYEYLVSQSGWACRKCPLIWYVNPEMGDGCFCESIGLYARWCTARSCGNYKLASKIAWRIAHLKVREGVECV